MSSNRSWYKASHSYAEVAIEHVRDCVAMLRSRGLKTDTALRDLAPKLGVTHRRIRTLFHKDGIPVVLHHEWAQLRYRTGLLFLNEAERLRNLADRYEEKGNDLVSGQMEFQWDITTNTPQRRFA